MSTELLDKVKGTEDEDDGLDGRFDDTPAAPEGAEPSEPDEETPVLDITTAVIPFKLMKVDGTEYKIFTLDHFSAEQEERVTALFARFQNSVRRLDMAGTDAEAKAAAKQVRHYRMKLIQRMTDVPLDVIESWNPGVQGRVLEAVAEEIGLSEEGEAGGGASVL